MKPIWRLWKETQKFRANTIIHEKVQIEKNMTSHDLE